MLGRLKSIFTPAVTDFSVFKTTMSTSEFESNQLVILSSLSRNLSLGSTAQPQIATFAAGCFWGVEHIFLKHFPPSEKKGILSTQVGYTGGNPLVSQPTYKLVCGGATDHAEALKIEFDPSIVTYDQLVGAYLALVRNIHV